jgi:YfiH family protein
VNRGGVNLGGVPDGIRWTLPDWPIPARVRAISTQRRGGVSMPPYDSLNLGDHVGDEPAAVAENRRRLVAAAGLPGQPCWLRQVHGSTVSDLDAAMPAATADAAVTRRAGRICVILAADCLPVLFASDSGAVVAAAHAGWRGLAAGVLEATVRAMDEPVARLVAWLGPAIGADDYEVGEEVRSEFLRRDPAAEPAFTANGRGRFQADLAWIARAQLAALGVTRLYGATVSTHAAAAGYFSHRRDGTTGRQASLNWLA